MAQWNDGANIHRLKVFARISEVRIQTVLAWEQSLLTRESHPSEFPQGLL